MFLFPNGMALTFVDPAFPHNCWVSYLCATTNFDKIGARPPLSTESTYAKQIPLVFFRGFGAPGPCFRHQFWCMRRPKCHHKKIPPNFEYFVFDTILSECRPLTCRLGPFPGPLGPHHTPLWYMLLHIKQFAASN